MSRYQFQRRKIGPLETLFLEGSEDGPTVILFHGFGADCTDLASLAQSLQAPKGTNWIFPNGHLSVALGPHMEGRAWFPISVSELEKNMAAGIGADFSAVVPPGLKRARENVFEMLEKLGAPMNRVVLGGFSQGGMLATDVALHSDQNPAGLAILSGTLVNAPVWKELLAKHSSLDFFQSHGFHDPVLSFGMAQRLEALLIAGGWKGRLLRFEGGHEIPFEVLSQMGAYLRKVLTS